MSEHKQRKPFTAGRLMLGDWNRWGYQRWLPPWHEYRFQKSIIPQQQPLLHWNGFLVTVWPWPTQKSYKDIFNIHHNTMTPPPHTTKPQYILFLHFKCWFWWILFKVHGNKKLIGFEKKKNTGDHEQYLYAESGRGKKEPIITSSFYTRIWLNC